jgi:Spy/CpxP family protein refolding chaperone
MEGTGMGMAKPAELNQYPGPRHVLDNAEALRLSDVQRTAIEASFREMKTEAVTLGRQIVEAEKRLDALFAERTASPTSVAQLTRHVAELAGQLRAVHLRAHLAVRAQLTPEQIEQYVTLRGYGHAGHPGH